MAIDACNKPGSDAASVPAGLCWRWTFIALFAIAQTARLLLALRLPPHADEAFYWQESHRLAWGYSDLPGLTAWLIRLGRALAGEGALAMRWPFLLLGALLPWLVVAWTRRHFGARHGWQAGLLALGLPLSGTLGVLALPDVPLTVAAMSALLMFDRALERGCWHDWIGFGVALAFAMASHYRAAMLLLAGLLFVLLVPRGRSVWRRGGWYIALVIGALGALPMLAYNLGHDWVGLAFQAVERNPWRFHADALRQPLEQALVVTPLLYGLLLRVTWRCLCRRGEGAPGDLAGVVAATFILGYFLAGLFADDLRFRLHWPLPGYLPLLAFVPTLLAGLRRRRAWSIATAVMLAVAQVLTLACLFAAARAGDGGGFLRRNGIGRTFAGWKEAGSSVTREFASDRGVVLVADNFKLAAELDFALHGLRPVYVLDSPANTKHGRAPQLAEWRLDAAALASAHAGDEALLAVDETSLREAARPAWLGSVCDGFDGLRVTARLDLPRMGRHVALYRGRVRAVPRADPRGRDACVVWQQAYAAAASRLR